MATTVWLEERKNARLNVLVEELRAEVERLREEVKRLSTPDMFWEESSAECRQIDEGSPEEHVSYYINQEGVFEFWQARRLPGVYVAYLPSYGDDGKNDWSFKSSSKAEAEAALAAEKAWRVEHQPRVGV